MTATVRAISAPELVKLRSSGQWSKFRICFIVSPAIFKAQVNQTFVSTDQVTTIIYNNVTLGAYTDIVAGMTVWVGTATGGNDLGQARVRSATATVLTIGRTSDIPWANDVFITVIDEMGLWAKQARNAPASITDVTFDAVVMDDDVAYTDQHKYMNPVPIMGGDRAVELPAVPGYVDCVFDAANSWFPDGSTLTSYLWTVSPDGVITGDTTATPSIRFSVAGYHRVTLTLTASNGKVTVGHRVVWVYDASTYAPDDQMTLDSFSGDIENGGWSAEITMYSALDFAKVVDRQKVIIVADDFYNGIKGSMGQMPGLEDNVMVGWIRGETIEYDHNLKTTKFKIEGAAYWAGKLACTSSLIEDLTDDPVDWLGIKNITINHAIWQMLYWRTTFLEVCDVYPTDKTTEIPGFVIGLGSVWDQIASVAKDRMFMRMRCDRYNRLFVETDPQLIAYASRAAIPVVMDITSVDWIEQIEIARKLDTQTGMLEAVGLKANGLTLATMYMCRAGGLAYKRFGVLDKQDRMICTSQANLNEQAGNKLAKNNNDYPKVTIPLGSNNRMIDIAPNQYLTLTVASADNNRGIVWTAKRLIPTRIDFTFDHEKGTVLTTVEAEPETIGISGTTVPMPVVPVAEEASQPLIGYDMPALPGFPLLAGGYGFPSIQDNLVNCRSGGAPQNSLSTGLGFTIYKNFLQSTFIAARFWARAAGDTYPTTVTLDIRPMEYSGGVWIPSTDISWLSFYLIDTSGARVATGAASLSGSLVTITFNNVAGLNIGAIEIAPAGEPNNPFDLATSYGAHGLLPPDTVVYGNLYTSADDFGSKGSFSAVVTLNDYYGAADVVSIEIGGSKRSGKNFGGTYFIDVSFASGSGAANKNPSNPELTIYGIVAGFATLLKTINDYHWAGYLAIAVGFTGFEFRAHVHYPAPGANPYATQISITYNATMLPTKLVLVKTLTLWNFCSPSTTPWQPYGVF